MKRLKINSQHVPTLATVLVFLMVYSLGGILFRGFFSLRVFFNLLTDNAFIGIVAVGMTFVIISNGIDLSVGSLVGLVGVMTANLFAFTSLHPILIILIVLCTGAVMGFLMGVAIELFELPPFLVTLVGMFLARGLCYMISLDSVPIKNDFFYGIYNTALDFGKNGRLPLIAIMFLIIVVLGALLARFTRFGRNVYAIGGNEASARLMGLPVKKTKLIIYTMNSTVCAFGGLIFSIYLLSGYPRAGINQELDVIASVVIGGTLLTGGVGTVEGTFIGVLILGLIQTFITFQGDLSTWWTKIVIGIFLLFFILLQKYLSSRSISRA